MRLIFHGALRERFGDSVTMEANTIAEAIEGFSRQTPWPADMVVDVVGYRTEESLRGFAREVHIMPRLHGGGGKFGAILIGAAMVGLAFATGGASLAATGLITTSMGASLLVAGGLMIAQGILGLFLKAPVVKGVKDPEASKYISPNQNTTSVNTPIIAAYGRINIFPQWLSIQSDSTNLSFGIFPAAPS